MHELSELLARATAAVESGYFHLSLAGANPVYRERVYCYELYHQLRVVWPDNSHYRLNGEVDKAAHPILKFMGVGRAKPDLLVHRPGYMEGNNTIIEVKSSSAAKRGIKKDLNTLGRFRTVVGYERGIYLIYGADAPRTAEWVRHIAQEPGGLPPIELWVHKTAGQAAVQVGILP